MASGLKMPNRRVRIRCDTDLRYPPSRVAVGPEVPLLAVSDPDRAATSVSVGLELPRQVRDAIPRRDP